MKLLLQLILIGSCTFSAQQANSQVFNEDFQSGIPANWTLINGDGLTPAPGVAQFTAAWIGAADFDNLVDTVAMSTSWYTPVGTSNDWLITPQIALTASNVLTWQEEGQDPAFPDGYEVRISTTTPTTAGFLANPALFSIATSSAGVWATRTVNLATAGYQNQSVYLAWRNTATDQFILMIDDIDISALLPADVAMSNSSVQEYTLVPVDQVTPIGTAGTITNIGTSAVTNANMTVNVYNGAMANVYTGTSNTVASIAAGGNSAVTNVGYTPVLPDVYTVELIANITQVDGNLSNNTVTYTYVVTDSTYARDNGVIVGTLGIGAGNGGVIGQQYTVTTADDLTSVSFHLNNAANGLFNNVITASVYNMSGGMPGTVIAQTEPLSITAMVDSFYTMPIVGGSINLAPGNYMVGLNEGDSSMTLGYTNDIVTPGTTWITWPTSPILPWANSEDFSFNVSYVIRPNFGLPPACLETSSTTSATGCSSYASPSGNYTWTADGQYMDTILNAAGCDSVMTINLTLGEATSTISANTCDSYISPSGNYTWTTSGTYNDTIPSSGGCDSIMVINLTIDVVNVAVTEAANVITASQAGAGYQWIDCGNGNAILTGETSQVYAPTANGDYAVIVTNGACTDTSACTTISTIGIDETVFSEGIDIYPNPSNGIFTITVNDLPIGQLLVEIVDARGRVLLTATKELVNGNGNVPVNLSDVEAGIYFVKLTSGDQYITERIVISKN